MPGLLLLLCAAPGNAVTFTWLSDLSGGTSYSVPTAVSADGKVVVGYSGSSNGEEAFRWENGVMIGLGDLPGRMPYRSQATAVSADGAIVAGTSGGYPSANRQQAFLWSNGLLTGLGSRPDCFQPPLSTANALSDDGSLLVGTSCAPNGLAAAVYRNGAWEDLGSYPTFAYSFGTAVSPDGNVIGGQEIDADLSGRAFLIQGGPITILDGTPVGADSAWPADISLNGAVVVGGFGYQSYRTQAYRYANGVMTGLGTLPGDFNDSYATGVSANGSVIVGVSGWENRYGYYPGAAFIWTQAHGMQSLAEVLLTQHAPGFRSGTYLGPALGVSADGLTIVGYGDGPGPGTRQAWIAVLDSPFAPDTDGDGLLDGVDNCTLVPNPSQCDSDGDEIGNHCDGDLTGNGFTNAQDSTLLRQALGRTSRGAYFDAEDLDCNGVVDAQDVTIFRGLLGRPPGPSGLVVP
jgi:probable HAF family extracellular repeat protein